MEKRVVHLIVRDDLELRQLAPEHAGALYALTDANREHLRPWLPWVDSTESVADTEAFIRAELEQHERGDGFQAGLWYQGRLAGAIGLHYLRRAEGETEIGYWLGAQFTGLGLMTDAVRALVGYAFSALGMERVVIRCASGNRRSRAVPERLGFTHAGPVSVEEAARERLVDGEVYALLASEWRSA